MLLIDISPPHRSVLSKLAEKDEIGKIYTLIAFAQSLMPLIGVPLVTMLFNATLEIDSGITFYVLSALSLPAIGISLYLDITFIKQKILIDP